MDEIKLPNWVEYILYGAIIAVAIAIAVAVIALIFIVVAYLWNVVAGM